MEEGIEKDEMGRKFIYSDTGVKVFVDFKDNLIVDPHDPNRNQIIRNIDVGSWAAKKRASPQY